MKWEDILENPPTSDDLTSYMVFSEILAFTEWRCYSSEQFPQIEWMIEEFIGGQAKMPGLISEELLAIRPIQILYGKTGPYNLRGATYLNGAYFEVTSKEGQVNILLFIDDDTANVFNYPSEGYIYTSQHFIKKEDGDEHGQDATPS